MKEAQKLNIPVFAIVDTNSNPELVDFPIPGNDDAFKSISIITKAVGSAIEQGLNERLKDKEEARIKQEAENQKRMAEAKAAEEPPSVEEVKQESK